MKFSNVSAVRIPSGSAKRIKYNGSVIWEPYQMRYVSLGDSIAAGHTINEDWDDNYGERSQYGKNGNTETAIVPGCYTDLIRTDLKTMFGKTKATSFARSGDTVADLMEKLDHDVVRDAISVADIVTICIGANDVLEPAMSYLDDYLNGDEDELNAIIEANLATLADDTATNSYTALFNKLAGINPNAKYVFTTIYNPYKYLYLEGGHYGFFGPLINTIPDMEIAGLDIDSFIKDSLLGTPAVENFMERINGMGAWAEKYVTRLNDVLRSKIAATGNANFLLADTKAVYDPVPDRPITSPKNYNDLVSVEYTRDYDTSTMDWGRLWEGSSAASFWLGLANEYTTIFPPSFDINGLAEDFVEQLIEKVVMPDVDPHPEEYGQYALRCSFADALGWEALPRRTIAFNAGTYGAGSMAAQKVVALDNLTAYANINANAFTSNTEGYRYTGWLDGGGTAYSNGQFVGFSGDLELTAQWSNVYTIAYCKLSENEYVDPEGETGPVTKDGSEYYLRVTLGGAVLPGLGDAFDSDGETPVRTITATYGTELYIQLINTGSKDRGKVYLNDAVVAGDAEYCYYTTQVTSDMAMTFTWEQEGVDSIVTEAQSYWICRIYTE